MPKKAVGSAKKSTKQGDINASELTMFITGMFGVIASMGGSHWLIDEDDAERISEPLATILNKFNKKRKDKINDLIAPMLLVTALGSILVPRILITLNDLKERKRYAAIKPGPDPRKTSTGDGANRSDATEHPPVSWQANEQPYDDHVSHSGKAIPAEIIRNLGEYA